MRAKDATNKKNSCVMSQKEAERHKKEKVRETDEERERERESERDSVCASLGRSAERRDPQGPFAVPAQALTPV